MHCTTCSALVEEDAKFCGECGTEVSTVKGAGNKPEAASQAFREQAATADYGSTAGAGSSAKTSDDYVKQGKEISKQFLEYAVRALKGPMAASRALTADDKVNGLIVHILFALLLPLFSYSTAKNFSSSYMNDLIEVPFGSVVVQPFFFLLLYLAVYTAVVFGVAKLMKAPVSYMEVMIRFGVFNIVPTALLLLALLFSLLSATVFSFFLFGVSLSVFVISSLAVIFSVKEKSTGGLDVYYGLIVANVAMIIILLVIGESIVGNTIEQLQDSLSYGLF